jgi:hypothetical protein
MILKKDFFHLRIFEQRQHLKIEFIEKLCQIFYAYSKTKHYSDENVFIQNSNLTKQTPTKHHRFSFIPRIIESFTNNRSLSSSQSILKHRPSSPLRNSVSNQQGDLERPTHHIASLIANVTNFIGGNHEM